MEKMVGLQILDPRTVEMEIISPVSGSGALAVTEVIPTLTDTGHRCYNVRVLYKRGRPKYVICTQCDRVWVRKLWFWRAQSPR